LRSSRFWKCMGLETTGAGMWLLLSMYSTSVWWPQL
jgi:hypothetical protein